MNAKQLLEVPLSMNRIFKINSLAFWLTILMYVAAAVLCYALLPQAEKFERSYDIGKPWSYGLVTAPMDFPVYKLEKDYERECDSAAMSVVPFVRKVDGVKVNYGGNVGRDIREVYSRGVLSVTDLGKIGDFSSSVVYLIEDGNRLSELEVDSLLTMKGACDVLRGRADVWSKQLGREVSIEDMKDMLVENVLVDWEKTVQSQNQARDAVSPTLGIVQEGEKIIDRGEVVGVTAYKNLLSLERLSMDMQEEGEVGSLGEMIGKMVLMLCFFLFLWLYFTLFRRKEVGSMRSMFFMIMMSVLMVVAYSSVVRFTEFSVYVIPIAILPIVVRIFFDSRTALYLHLITVLVVSMMVPSPYEFVLIQIAVGMVAVSSLRDLHARSQLMASALWVLLTYAVMYTCIELLQGKYILDVKGEMYLVFLINAVLILFVYGLIYIVEKLFGFLSSMTLVELANMNNRLMMDFSEKCPGTFQHVLQVSNLSVEVAKKINADMLLVRTGALYHDIGKMDNPMLYTENQAMGVNPLMDLPFDEAAQIVISHVQSGVKLAQKNLLPKEIVEFIAMHHGTAKTRFFYNSFVNAHPDEEVNESLFTYGGPLPRTKETVIVMMADCIEAASRSLKDYNEESIDGMVESIIDGQMAEGQYKEAPISFLEVEMAKKVFKEKLKTVYHNRISYPSIKKSEGVLLTGTSEDSSNEQ